MHNLDTPLKDIQKYKQQIRKQIIKKRMSLSDAELASANFRLTEIVLNQKVFAQANVIAAYYPYNGEISPLAIVDYALKNGKRCFLPKMNFAKKHHLDFYEYKLGDKLISNKVGILEPKAEEKKKLKIEDLDLIIAPCVAFDKNNYRLGLGGAYYDVFIKSIKEQEQLNKNPNSNNKVIVAAVAHSFQKIDKLPVESCDMPVDYVFTEKL